MLQGSSARTIDISGLVRLRKHLSWSANVMGAFGGIGIVVAVDKPELRDAVYIGADGVLAFVTGLVLFKGLVGAIAPLSIVLVTLNTILTARFVAASMPIDTKDERGMLAVGVMAMAASLYASQSRSQLTRSRSEEVARRSLVRRRPRGANLQFRFPLKRVDVSLHLSSGLAKSVLQRR